MSACDRRDHELGDAAKDQAIIARRVQQVGLKVTDQGNRPRGDFGRALPVEADDATHFLALVVFDQPDFDQTQAGRLEFVSRQAAVSR